MIPLDSPVLGGGNVPVRVGLAARCETRVRGPARRGVAGRGGGCETPGYPAGRPTQAAPASSSSRITRRDAFTEEVTEGGDAGAPGGWTRWMASQRPMGGSAVGRNRPDLHDQTVKEALLLSPSPHAITPSQLRLVK